MPSVQQILFVIVSGRKYSFISIIYILVICERRIRSVAFHIPYKLLFQVRRSTEMLNTLLKSNLLVQFVSIVDVLFALIVVAPLVVTFWSTTWMLYDAFILPNDPVLSGIVSWSFGFFGQMILMFYQDAIKKFLNFEKRPFLNVLCLKFYALFLGHTFVSFWRGVWMCVDATSSKELGVVCSNIIQNIITLMILKAFRNSLVPPFIILTDTPEQYSMRTLLEKHVSLQF